MDVLMCSITTRNDNLQIATGFVVGLLKDGHFYSVNWCKGPCTYDVRTEGGRGVQELPNFVDG